MGWTVPYSTPKLQDLVRMRTKTQEWDSTSGRVSDVVLKHCYRGGRFSGIIWTVHERTVTPPTGPATSERWIGCDLVRYYPTEGRYGGNWGYKDIEACMGPNEVSCPIGYLKMVPPHHDSPACYCHEWRKRVEAHDALGAEARAKVKALQPNAIVTLKPGCSPNQLVIVSIRPLVGESGGRKYKIKAKQLA